MKALISSILHLVQGASGEIWQQKRLQFGISLRCLATTRLGLRDVQTNKHN